jgi:hypothetical protein
MTPVVRWVEVHRLAVAGLGGWDRRIASMRSSAMSHWTQLMIRLTLTD